MPLLNLGILQSPGRTWNYLYPSGFEEESPQQSQDIFHQELLRRLTNFIHGNNTSSDEGVASAVAIVAPMMTCSDRESRTPEDVWERIMITCYHGPRQEKSLRKRRRNCGSFIISPIVMTT